ncbi:uncharacterized protein PHACADRAFT_254492 [Phanerochaete carnosa HHB-10118-sp]|uniref:Heterokaryon incompatibility domain-containing protein n=1 Tax=Phanerochaete carnosa (strain HHB-10118-sp) TaxID=650164 RepID=K5VZL0_PHACS|nr:uncharacterized protein PHACADRAFT_254492 [Phanerochaete carnosa HHB-10118-sp]EKM57018.1 hypothetical protein PHACADRAFT_254492 [Phanerochaete carnosa HHB-10118-sp]
MANRNEDTQTSANQRNRTIIWGLIQMVTSGIVPTYNLFQSECSNASEIYTLTPSTPSTVPLQCVHIGQGAIPNTLADIPCDRLSIDDLLAELNKILGTSYTLDTPGLHDFLDYALGTSHDFGEVYGTLRSLRLEWSHWRRPEDSAAALAEMKRRRHKIQQRRNKAIRGRSVQDTQIPPRRVWDLYSNRVLPYHVMPPTEFEFIDFVPDELWTVSHSWVHAQEREDIMTPINGCRWPVPLPRGISLDHIRIELLNMGAEYVWLDVLCLWQEGITEDDKARLEEWKLDVPTIGHIYQARPYGRPCVTYFNGLGLPLDPSPAVIESDRHWFNRVWTLQETLPNWIPGGLTAVPHSDSPSFFSHLQNLLRSLSTQSHFQKSFDAPRAMAKRYCTTELDRIAGIGYFLQCPTLPLYDRSASLESAWALLIKHMDAQQLTRLFIQYESDVPFGLFVSWAGFLASRPALQCSWQLMDLLDPHTNKLGQYFHEPLATTPCYIISSPGDTHQDSGPQALQLHFYNRTDPITVQVSTTGTHGCLVPNVPYRLLHIGGSGIFWAVVEVVGERGRRGERTLEVIKWGMIQIDRSEGWEFRKLGLAAGRTKVVYLSGKDALAKSGHVDKYIEAFNRARKNLQAENKS